MRKDLVGVKGQLTKTHQNLVRMMFRDLVVHTPQWSGELALHWTIEFHGYTAIPAYSLQNSAFNRRNTDRYGPIDPMRMGMEPAVSLVLSREFRKLQDIRYNSIVKFTNKMPYASNVENNEGPEGREIREVNRLASYGGVAMIGYIDSKYKNLRQIKKAIPK